MEGPRYILILLAILLLPNLAFADAVNSEWYSSTRALSMGNVGIANSEGSAEAMFYNPAALARVKRTVVEYFNLQTEFGKDLFGISGGQKNYGKNFHLDQLYPLLQKHPGSVSSLGASSFPNFHTQNFNFGVLGNLQSWSYYDGSKLIYRTRDVLMPTLGMSIGLLGGRLKFGLALRAIQLTVNDQSVTSFSRVGYLTDAKEGFGFGIDGGMIMSLPWSMLPTTGLVVRNFGSTRFTSSAPWGLASGTVKRPDPIPMTVDMGFALFPKIAKNSVLTMAADYRDALGKTGLEKRRKVNLGMELSLGKKLFLRGGESRGYLTGGFGIATKYGTLDIGTYAEEIGTSFWGKADRRYSIKFGNRF